MIQSYHINQKLSSGGGKNDNQSLNGVDSVTNNRKRSRRCGMLTVERQAELLEILKREKSATVAALTKRLYASEATVRRDLAALEAQGYLKRVHGRCGDRRRARPRDSLRGAGKRAGAGEGDHGAARGGVPAQRGRGIFWTGRHRRSIWLDRSRRRRTFWW